MQIRSISPSRKSKDTDAIVPIQKKEISWKGHNRDALRSVERNNTYHRRAASRNTQIHAQYHLPQHIQVASNLRVELAK